VHANPSGRADAANQGARQEADAEPGSDAAENRFQGAEF